MNRVICCLIVAILDCCCTLPLGAVEVVRNTDWPIRLAEPGCGGADGVAVPEIVIRVDKTRVDMGRSVTLEVAVQFADDAPRKGWLVLPYVNARRWGAHEYLDAAGTATIHLPLPNPPKACIQVEIARQVAPRKGHEPRLFTGHRLPVGAKLSNAVEVIVDWKLPQRPSRQGDRLIGMQWEPWFTPRAARWDSSQATPLVGYYRTYDRDVARQHMLWLTEVGVDFILVDWSNHIWGKEHWDERGEHCNTIIHGTTLVLDTMAEMKAEGIDVPAVAIMTGLCNGPPAHPQALKEEHEWIYHNYVRNPLFEGLWQEFDGKPLIVPLDTQTMARTYGMIDPADIPAEPSGPAPPPVHDVDPGSMADWNQHFTVRWMSALLDIRGHQEYGYWSWMDGGLQPVVTYREGKPEATTVSIAFFGSEGWTGPGTHGRRNGSTYIETFKTALRHRPRVVLLHQFNEFASQKHGEGHGPDKNIFVDSFTCELSDDIEPVSITSPGYRIGRGWGFYYLNLTAALIDLYHQDEPDATIVTIAEPLSGATVDGDMLSVVWNSIGREAESFCVLVDGVVVAEGLAGAEATVDISALSPGPHRLAVQAEGAYMKYPLSYTQLDRPLTSMVPATAEITIVK